MKNFFYLLLASGLIACNKETESAADPNRLFGNDFENLEGWLGDTPVPSLTREKAHSGNYALKVGGNNAYSLGYQNLLGRMHDRRFDKVKVSAWVYAPGEGTAALLVTQLDDPAGGAKPLLWDGLDLVKTGQGYNKWVQVSKVITLPAAATATTKLRVYVWQPSPAAPVYLDDLAVSLEK